MSEFSPEDVVTKLGQLGYDGVEWRVHETGHIHPDKILQQAEYFKKLSINNGLEIAALAPYLGPGEIERLRKIFEGCAMMGCPQFRVVAHAYDREKDYNVLYHQMVDQFGAVEELAKTYGVKANIEIHMGNITPSASLAYRLVSNFDPECIGVIYDPGNMVFEGFENWRLGMQLLGAHLAHVHVKNAHWIPDHIDEDSNLVWRPEWTTLRSGFVDWRQVIDDLRSIGYQGYLSFEDFSKQLDTEEKIADDLKYLKQFI